jgi:hypothetical protein
MQALNIEAVHNPSKGRPIQIDMGRLKKHAPLVAELQPFDLRMAIKGAIDAIDTDPQAITRFKSFDPIYNKPMAQPGICRKQQSCEQQQAKAQKPKEAAALAHQKACPSDT